MLNVSPIHCSHPHFASQLREPDVGGVACIGTQGYEGFMGRTAIMAIVGGTASAIGGGKFANGALSAAVVYLFNDMGKVAYHTEKTLGSIDKIKGWFESLNKAENGLELVRIYKDQLANFQYWLDNNPDSPNYTQMQYMMLQYRQDMEYAVRIFTYTGVIVIKREDGTWKPLEK